MRTSAARTADPTSNRRRSATLRDLDDAALLASIAAGNGDAMRSLFLRYRLHVYRFVLRLLNNAELADDLTSEVFLDVWRQSRQFEGRSTVATWIFAIARNKALATRRRQRHAPLEEAWLETIEDTADDPEAAVQKIDRRRLLRQILAVSPSTTGRSLTSSTTMRNRFPRSQRSLAFFPTLQRHACSMRASTSPSG